MKLSSGLLFTLYFGPPSPNDRLFILFLIGVFAALWLLSLASKWITERIWKGKAKMQNISDELRAVVDHAVARLELISDADSSVRTPAGKWSKKEILGHLIDSATNNHQRFVRGQLSSEIKLPGYEQEAWVSTQAYHAEAWPTLIQFWKMYNLHLVHIISNIPPEKLSTTCFIGDNPPVTLEFIITDYLRHMRHHLEQIYM